MPVLVVIDRPERSRQQLQNIEQVNKYALWCIENAMWNEAQSHLERALAQDSLSASFAQQSRGHLRAARHGR